MHYFKNLSKRGISLALALVMCLAMLPGTAFAATASKGDLGGTIGGTIGGSDLGGIKKPGDEITVPTIPTIGGGEDACPYCGKPRCKLEPVEEALAEDGQHVVPKHYESTGCKNLFTYPGKQYTTMPNLIVHEYDIPLGVREGYEATCTKKGFNTYQCSVAGCEKICYKQEIPALGHDYVGGVCTRCNDYCEHQYADGKCTVCGVPEGYCYHKNVSYIDNGDGTHSTVCDSCKETVVEAEAHTATSYRNNNDGTHTGTCGDCGAEIAPAEHDWNEANCQSAAFCSMCDATEGEKNPDNHVGKLSSWSGVGYSGDPNWYHIQKCTSCNAVVNKHVADEYQDYNEKQHWTACKVEGCGYASSIKYNHTWSYLLNWVWDGSYESFGSLTLDWKCYICDAMYHQVNTSDNIVKVVRHTAVDDLGEYAYYDVTIHEPYNTSSIPTATAIVSGTNNGRFYKDHHYSEWSVTVMPTATEAGEAQRACIAGVCDHVETVVLPALGQGNDNWTWAEVTAPTCTEIGKGEYTYTDGTTIEVDIPATGHDFSEWVQYELPTETTSGQDIRFCHTCGLIETQISGATPEDVVIDEPDTPLAGMPIDLDPADQLTRGTLAFILYWHEGSPETALSTYPDVSADAIYAEAIGWVEANDIIAGYENGNFGPEDAVTYEQLVEILTLYVQYLGVDYTVEIDAAPEAVVIWVEAEAILNNLFEAVDAMKA